MLRVRLEKVRDIASARAIGVGAVPVQNPLVGVSRRRLCMLETVFGALKRSRPIVAAGGGAASSAGQDQADASGIADGRRMSG